MQLLRGAVFDSAGGGKVLAWSGSDSPMSCTAQRDVGKAHDEACIVYCVLLACICISTLTERRRTSKGRLSTEPQETWTTRIPSRIYSVGALDSCGTFAAAALQFLVSARLLLSAAMDVFCLRRGPSGRDQPGSGRSRRVTGGLADCDAGSRSRHVDLLLPSFSPLRSSLHHARHRSCSSYISYRGH